MFCKSLLVVILTVAATVPAAAQEWAKKLFETTTHDFGSVARGAKAEYEYVLNNIYVEDLHIASVQSSCGCTQVQIKKPDLKTYQQGAIVATINTQAFTGQRGATVTVTFDKPYYAEVQLHTSVYIRSDVVFTPGSVQFDTVDQGHPAERQVAVNYAGRDDWQILEVKSANPHVSAVAVQTVRGNGQVAYNLVVRLSGAAPAGYLDDRLVLVTNDQASPQIPLALEGLVEPSVMISPESLFMGVLQPGEKVTKQLVVRGKKPFRVESVTCQDPAFHAQLPAESAATAKTLHVIPVTFEAGDSVGKVLATIRVHTSLADTAPQLSACAVVSH
jgi:hypothetical protein